MASSEKQRLMHVASIIRNWDPEGTIIEIEHAFFILDEIPKNKYKNEWEQVREAIREHQTLNTPLIKNQISTPVFSRNGRWWWDPSEW